MNAGSGLARMRARVMLLAAIVAAFAGSTVAVPSARAATLEARIGRAVAKSGLAGRSSVYVWDQQSGAVRYAWAPDVRATPASTMKLLTSAAALDRFGADHRFRTRLALRGRQVGDRWLGDVWLVGGGDPSLSTFGFARANYGGDAANLASLVSPLRRRGIDEVTGRIMVDDDLFDELRWVPEWKPSFRFEETGALGALTVNQSLLGSSVGSRSSRRPDIQVGQTYRELLRRQGIVVDGATRPGSVPATATFVGKVSSPPLGRLLGYMNRTSDNFHAEILLKQLGADRYHPVAGASTIDGRRAARAQLRRLGVDLRDLTWIDGSGLAYGNRVTARLLADVLSRGASAPWGATWVDSFARSGGTGTLRRRMTRPPYRGRVRAKTGTLLHSSALAGFSDRLGSGRRFGFAVISSNPSGARIDYTAARRLQDSVATILVR